MRQTFATSQHHHSKWSRLYDRFPPSLWGGALANSWVRQQIIWMMWTEPMMDQGQCTSCCIRPRVISKVQGSSLRATSHGYASQLILVTTVNTWIVLSHCTVNDDMSTEIDDSWHLVLLLRCTIRPSMTNVTWCESMSTFTAEKWLDEGWIRGGVWGIVLHNPCWHIIHILLSIVSVHSLLLSAPITCASTMAGPMPLLGSRSHWKGTFVVHVCVRHY